MLPKGNIQQKGYFAYRVLCAVIHVVWIAAFLILTAFEEFLYHTFSCAPNLRGARISYISGCYNKGYPRCRSPPSDFDFAYQPKIEIGGITHERDQSAGLLPVLYTGHYC